METKKPEEIALEMGFRLRRARIEANMTQKELSARAGIGLNRLGDMEQGKATTALESWIKVSLVLGLTEGWQEVFAAPEDPFEEYDRRREEREDIMKTRVRKSKRI